MATLLLTAMLAGIVHSLVKLPRCLFYRHTWDTSMLLDMTEEYYKGMNYAWINSSTITSRVELTKPILQSDKYSFSLLFWPFDYLNGNFSGAVHVKNDSTCARKYGLNSFDIVDSRGFTAELINSMTFFESLWLTKDRSNMIEDQKIYFAAYTLDKSSKGNEIGRRFRGEISVKGKDGMNCTNVKFVSIDKTYIICWEVVIGSDHLTSLLRVRLSKWLSNLVQGQDESQVEILMNKTQSEQIAQLINNQWFNLKATICKNSDKNRVDVLLMARGCSFFMVMELENDKFKAWRYPEQSSEQGIKMNQITWGDTAVDIFSAEHVDNLRFIITENSIGFDNYKNETYPKLFYFDLERQTQPAFLGKGIFVSFKKQLDENKDSYVSNALMVVSADLLLDNTTTLKIQSRKFYKGSFFGDETFLLNITGSPLYFKGYYTSDFVVYLTWSNRTRDENCNMTYYDGELFMAQASRPERITRVMQFQNNFSNPEAIAASPFNNILYIRYRYKLEVFNLQNSFINFTQKLVDVYNSSNSFIIPTFLNKPYMFKVETSKTVDKPVLLEKELKNRHLIGLYVGIEPSGGGNSQAFDRVVQNNMEIDFLNSNNYNLPIQNISQVYYYTTSLDEINFGNFLSYQSPLNNQSGKVVMNSFNEEVITFTNPARKVQYVFSYNCKGKLYLMISYLDNPENILYEVVGGNRLVEKLNFYDRRPINSVQKLSNTQQLIHIDTLLYELNLETFQLTPIFKSGDYCGDKYTMIDHVELGMLTICGGMDIISVYLTDPKKKNVDLSSPIKNLKVEMTTYHSLKSEKIFKIFSARDYNNHFGIITNLIFKPVGFFTFHECKLRLFEICTTNTQVEIVTELETTIVFDDLIDDINVVLVKEHLVVFAYKKSMDGKTVREYIKVYYITKAMNLIEQKKIEVPPNLKMNLQVNRPLSTYLTSSKNILQRKYGPKIVLIMTHTMDKHDILQNFDFIESEDLKQNGAIHIKKNLLAVLDPSQPSTNCFKLLELPDGFEVDSFGPYFINSKEQEAEVGVTILGRKGSDRKVFFLNDHSLSIDFYAFDSLNNYFTDSKKKSIKFMFTVKNYFSNSIKTLNAVFETIQDYSSNNLNVSRPIIDVRLVDIAGNSSYYNFIENYSNGTVQELINGSAYSFEFNYDSKIEQIASLIKGSVRMLERKFPLDSANEIREMVSFKMEYIPEENAFGYPIIDRLYPLSIIDYKALLHAKYPLIYPLVKSKINGPTNQMLNPNFSKMRRCTRFYFIQHPDDLPIQTIACILISSKDHTSDYSRLSIHLFHNKSTYTQEDLPSPAFELADVDSSKDSFDDIQLASTLNNVILYFTNGKTDVTYKYRRFIVVKNGSDQLNVVAQPFRDTWSINPCFVNNFFKYPYESVVGERFCMVTRIEGHVVQYYCTFRPDNKSGDQVTIDSRIDLKSIDIFKYLQEDEKSTLNPSLLIYDQFSNPTVMRGSPIVTDKYLYFVYAVDTWLGVFVRLDPLADDRSQLENGTVRFVVMNNPFDGYKFDKEVHLIDRNFYVRAFALKKTNTTYLAYYNLPFDLVSDFENYIGFYTNKDMLEPQPNLTSIESKYIHKVDRYLLSLDVLNLDFGRRSESLGNVEMMHTSRKQLELMKEASHLLLIIDEKDIVHLEYFPRIEVAVSTSLLLSRDLKVDIRGMYNTSSSIQFNLVSGNYTELMFLFMYLLPLFGVVLVLFLLNWLMNYFFNRMEMTEGMNSPMKSGSVEGLLTQLFTSQKVMHKTLSSNDKSKDSVAHSNIETTKVLHLSLKKIEEQERKDLEDFKNLKKKKEIKGIRLLSEDGEGYEEAIQVDYMRDLYKVGVLKIEADQQTESELNRAFIQERNLSFFSIEAEREKSILLTPEELGIYEDFDQYMKKRYRKDRASLGSKAILPASDKPPLGLPDAPLSPRRKTGRRTPPSHKSSKSQGSDQEDLK